MDYFYELYAAYILKRAIELGKDDVLSINTEERYVPFARLLAEKAKEITGNGSYLVIIENKRAKEAVEIFSDYLIEKTIGSIQPGRLSFSITFQVRQYFRRRRSLSLRYQCLTSSGLRR